jgi:hypothetical protein
MIVYYLVEWFTHYDKLFIVHLNLVAYNRSLTITLWLIMVIDAHYVKEDNVTGIIEPPIELSAFLMNVIRYYAFNLTISCKTE